MSANVILNPFTEATTIFDLSASFLSFALTTKVGNDREATKKNRVILKHKELFIRFLNKSLNFKKKDKSNDKYEIILMH